MSVDAPHLTDERLLLLVDGELQPRPAEAARRHLKACASCRTRFEQIEASAAEFGHAYRQDRAEQTPSPGPLRHALRAQLADIEQQSRPAASWTSSRAQSSWEATWCRVPVQPERAGGGPRPPHRDQDPSRTDAGATRRVPPLVMRHERRDHAPHFSHSFGRPSFATTAWSGPVHDYELDYLITGTRRIG